MSARVGLHRNRWHQYAFGNSQWQPGVTTILRVQDSIGGSDGLLNWAVNTALAVVEKGGSLEEARTATTAARDRGTKIHAGIEAMIRDEDHLPSIEDGKVWYAWSRFLLKERPDIIATERMVFNPKANYGGTLDLDAVVRGKRALVDVKTGKAKPSHALQLAGLSAPGAFWGEADDPEKHEMPEFEAFYVLLLNDEGYELVPLVVSEDETKHFLYLAETYHKLRAWSAREKSLEVAA